MQHAGLRLRCWHRALRQARVLERQLLRLIGADFDRRFQQAPLDRAECRNACRRSDLFQFAIAFRLVEEITNLLSKEGGGIKTVLIAFAGASRRFLRRHGTSPVGGGKVRYDGLKRVGFTRDIT